MHKPEFNCFHVCGKVLQIRLLNKIKLKFLMVFWSLFFGKNENMLTCPPALRDVLILYPINASLLWMYKKDSATVECVWGLDLSINLQKKHLTLTDVWSLMSPSCSAITLTTANQQPLNEHPQAWATYRFWEQQRWVPASKVYCLVILGYFSVSLYCLFCDMCIFI